MQDVLSNPYRILGLLSNATKREQAKQINRINHFIDAQIEPEEGYSFLTLGKVNWTKDELNEAVSKLTLDQDKMTASLFWFYIGNSITDEPAFDALKDSDLDTVISIWTKLTESGEVTERSASAYSNLSTLYLSGILEGTNSKEKLLQKGISLKLKFIESDYIKSLKEIVTDDTFKISKKQLQLIFLNQLLSDNERSKRIGLDKFMDIVNKIEFSAKEDFINEFIQKPITLIERKIEETKNKRKNEAKNSIKFGKELYKLTANELGQLKSILEISNHKYTSISDKLANEILQCSIDYYNDCQDKDLDNNYVKPAMDLAKIAKKIASGKLANERIDETIGTYDEMKDFELIQAIQWFKSIKNAFEENKQRILKEVKSMQLGYNQTVNWTKVDQAINDSLDWNKIVDLLQEKIPQSHIDKIKSIANDEKVSEFKALVNFVYNKLPYMQKRKIKYILYWDTSAVLPDSGDVESIPDWIKWVGGIILFFILMKACN
jgi:hypothetical protein